MKNLYLSFLLIGFGMLLSGTAQSQTVNQGAWMIGGGISYSSLSSDLLDDNINTFVFAPSVGYFVIDNLGVGLGVDFTSVSIDGESESSTFLTPAVRYYVFDAIFGQVSYRLATDDEDPNELGIGAGYSFFVNNAVAIEPMIRYSLISRDDDDANEIGLFIAIRAFIGRE
ncbi:MAG: outer membrane beta-barrel protein [Saprospiraceae bacterium]|nr:outer membrane beta-barrel protein [Saprospiraceae bacterium]